MLYYLLIAILALILGFFIGRLYRTNGRDAICDMLEDAGIDYLIETHGKVVRTLDVRPSNILFEFDDDGIMSHLEALELDRSVES